LSLLLANEPEGLDYVRTPVHDKPLVNEHKYLNETLEDMNQFIGDDDEDEDDEYC
jgi:hypothetical protein